MSNIQNWLSNNSTLFESAGFLLDPYENPQPSTSKELDTLSFTSDSPKDVGYFNAVNPKVGELFNNPLMNSKYLTHEQSFNLASDFQNLWNANQFTPFKGTAPGDFNLNAPEEPLENSSVEFVADSETTGILSLDTLASAADFNGYMALGAAEAFGITSANTAYANQLDSQAQSTFRYGLGNQINQNAYTSSVNSSTSSNNAAISLGAFFGPIGVTAASIYNAFQPQPGSTANLDTTYSTGGQMVDGTSSGVVASL